MPSLPTGLKKAKSVTFSFCFRFIFGKYTNNFLPFLLTINLGAQTVFSSFLLDELCKWKYHRQCTVAIFTAVTSTNAAVITQPWSPVCHCQPSDVIYLHHIVPLILFPPDFLFTSVFREKNSSLCLGPGNRCIIVNLVMSSTCIKMYFLSLSSSQDLQMEQTNT